MLNAYLGRRIFLLGGLSLPGCAALNSLNQAAQPRDTYDLNPVTVSGARRGNRTLLVLEPTAPAVLATDRMLIRPVGLSVAYIPDARWADDTPRMMQSLLIRSLASAGAFGFVGAQGAGPVPDLVLLTRIDAFGVDVRPDGGLAATVRMEVTILRDRDQRVIGTRVFQGAAMPSDDQAGPIALAFQQILDTILPQIVDWVAAGG